MTRTVLVIGATGILAPAAGALASRGDTVITVSRHGSGGSIGVDGADAAALADALGVRTWDDALVYGPAVSEHSLALVRARTPGRCVLVRTSAAADPARGDVDVPPDTLQLGWTAARPARWHTPAEVSDAALAVLSDGEARILGVVRPWSDKP